MNLLSRLRTPAVFLVVGITSTLAPGQDRVRDGLLTLYDFDETSGDVVYDRSGTGPPINLTIHNPASVVRLPGSLEVIGDAHIESDDAPSRLIQEVIGSGEITIEAWIRPAGTSRTGPARIVTLSQGQYDRNFTLGQQGDTFDVRFRTNTTGDNGDNPSLSTSPGSLTNALTHVVYTRHNNGSTRIYLNAQQEAYDSIGGDTSDWNAGFRMALANEIVDARPWRGAYYLVAIYGRALSQREVDQNFRAGAHAKSNSGPFALEPGQQPRFERFDDVPFPLWEVPLPQRVPRSMNNGSTMAGASEFESSFSAVFEAPAHFPFVGFGRCGAQRLRDAAFIYEGMTLAVDDEGRYEVRMVIEAPRRPTVIRLQLEVHQYFPDSTAELRLVSAPVHRGTITLAPISLTPDDKAARHETSHTYMLRRGGYSHLLREIAAENESRFRIMRNGTARFGSIPD